MKRLNRVLTASLVTLASLSPLNHASAQESFRLAWSIYVGWMPWDYADKAGIVKKWADKYDIEIEVVQINDYVESINQYSAGEFDACVMTNMDALTIPAASGVDTTALIVGDFSNGNDAVILKDGSSMADLKGKPVNLVELSVSHYLLARGLDSVGLSERDVSVINTSDADMVAAYSTDDVEAVVTWNPLVSEIMSMPNATKVFDSSQIAGEIIDATMVNTQVMEDNPAFAKALTGAWYETMSIMSQDTAAGREARAMMAEASGTDLAGYDAQLAATRMFYQPSDAADFVNSPALAETMQYVADFSFQHGLLGEGAPDAGFIGVAFPTGTINGDQGNIQLRFTDEYMQMAADGAL